ncbi:MAG: nucleotide modification associated domain-containing protein [Methanogenium sp.]|jgi:hypothetical protein
MEKRINDLINEILDYKIQFGNGLQEEAYIDLSMLLLKKAITSYKFFRFFKRIYIKTAIFLLNYFQKSENFLEEVGELVIAKNKDYGEINLKEFGKFGIIVRLNDKINRYYNIKEKETTEVNESIVDTTKDIIGYCLLLLCYSRK